MSDRPSDIRLLDELGSAINESNPLPVNLMSGFVVPESDYIGITYVEEGYGIGEIDTITYMIGGSGGTVVATLFCAYDVNGNLASVTQT